MDEYSFHKKVNKQPVYWVSRLEFSAEDQRVELVLIANPETMEREATINFDAVREVQAGATETDTPDCLPQLIGIINRQEGAGTRYIITLETSELSFYTDQDPRIDWVDPSKPYQKWDEEKLAQEDE